MLYGSLSGFESFCMLVYGLGWLVRAVGGCACLCMLVRACACLCVLCLALYGWGCLCVLVGGFASCIDRVGSLVVVV